MTAPTPKPLTPKEEDVLREAFPPATAISTPTSRVIGCLLATLDAERAKKGGTA